MSQLQVTARLEVHEGRLDEFKAVARDCMESVRLKDSGTLQYDWFLSADQTECVVRETYASSEAVLEHIVNLGNLFETLLSVPDIDIEVYGTPSDELMEATAAFEPRVYAHFQSI